MRLLYLATLVPVMLCGCRRESAAPDRPADRMVYVDLQTREPIVLEATDAVPAVHPQTGEQSLMPGLYCSACEKWHPAPPLVELQRNPAAQQCPQCHVVMSADGPWPEPTEQEGSP